MWTNLFTIGTTDLTQWERTEEHDVNREDVYEVWTDGNWVDHRVTARTRISGTVVLSFSRAADFSSFLSLLSTARDEEGYYPISVYCSNTGTVETINAYLDIAGETRWNLVAPTKHNTVTVQITGR